MEKESQSRSGEPNRMPSRVAMLLGVTLVFWPFLELVRVWRQVRYALMRAARRPWAAEDDALLVECASGTRRIPFDEISRGNLWLEEHPDDSEILSSLVVIRTRDGSRYVLDACDAGPLETRGVVMGATRTVVVMTSFWPVMMVGWLLFIGLPLWLLWSGIVPWPWGGAWLVVLFAVLPWLASRR